MLKQEFYLRGAIEVAKDLLGHLLVRKTKQGKIVARIVETEAYVGPEDKACHAYDNKKTKRTKAMFKAGGYSYVYLIYGMHNCFNVVTASKGKPEAVLIRAVEPVAGLDLIKQNRDIKSGEKNLTNGPGKLSQALKIDRSLNGIKLFENDKLYLKAGPKNKFTINTGARINIDYAEEYTDKPWRFYIAENSFLSKSY